MRRAVSILAGLLCLAAAAQAEIRFPAPEFKDPTYQFPQTQMPAGRSAVMAYVDVALVAGALGLMTWLVYARRSRRWVFVLMLACLGYFGFYRHGCVCPVGSIQNVASAAGGHVALPWTVAAFFLLPLGFALFAGRVFCAGVCPLGAIQDAVHWKTVRVPAWLEQGLGLLPFLYLGLGALYAYAGSRFIICEYDPFVSFFRFSGTAHMLLLGGVLLAASVFVGRVYCRFLCPYSVLLRWLSPLAGRRVSITPAGCIDCRLCEGACPFGAIRHPTPVNRNPSAAAGRGALVALLALLPVIVGGLGVLGYLAGPALSRGDAVVQLAERLGLEETGVVKGFTEQSEAYRNTGEPLEAVYARAIGVRRQFAVGAAGLGAFMGLVIGLKLVAHAVRRRRIGYTTDPAGCLACARCYKSCPVEIERRQAKGEEALVSV